MLDEPSVGRVDARKLELGISLPIFTLLLPLAFGDMAGATVNCTCAERHLVSFRNFPASCLPSPQGYTVEARKFEHGCPPTTNLRKKGDQHIPSYILVLAFWSLSWTDQIRGRYITVSIPRPIEPQ